MNGTTDPRPIDEIEASKPKTFQVPVSLIEDFEAGYMTWSDLLTQLKECSKQSHPQQEVQR